MGYINREAAAGALSQSCPCLHAGYHPSLAGGSTTSGASDAERLVAAKLDLRRQQMQAAVGGVEQQQGSGTQSKQPQPQPQPQQHGQQDGLQPPAQTAQQQRQQPGSSRAQPVGRAALPPELQRAVAEAQAALAAVGGSSTAAVRRSGGLPGSGQAQTGKHGGLPAARPLIRRQPLGAKAVMQQLASSAEGVGTSAGQGRIGDRGAAAGGAAAGGSRSGAIQGSNAEQAAADEDYRARLPDGDSWRNWKAAAAAAADSSQGGSGAAVGASQQAVMRGAEGGQLECEAEERGAEEEEDEEAQERRSSPIVELSMLLAECVRHGLRTIAFCKSRCGAASGCAAGWESWTVPASR